MIRAKYNDLDTKMFTVALLVIRKKEKHLGDEYYNIRV